MVVLLTALLYPVCGPRGMALTVSGLLRLVFAEAVLGVLMGLAAQFVFEAAQFAGQLMGMQVGFGLVNIIDPNTQVDTPVLAVFSQTIVDADFSAAGRSPLVAARLGQQLRLSAGGGLGLAAAGGSGHLLHAAGRHLAGRRTDRGAHLGRDLAGRFDARFSGKGFAAIAGPVSWTVGRRAWSAFSSWRCR